MIHLLRNLGQEVQHTVIDTVYFRGGGRTWSDGREGAMGWLDMDIEGSKQK